jgi:hypothetical protein
MQAAFAKLAEWTGVAPVVPGSRIAPEPRPPRIPPAMVNALRAARRTP